MLRCSLLAVVLAALTVSSASAQEKNRVVLIETSMGNIKVELFKDKAPITVKNFLKYAEDGHFDDTIFHRVIKDFMIQGGGFSTDKREKKTADPPKKEAGHGLSNVTDTTALAN